MPRNLCQMAIKKRIMTAKVIGYMKPDIDPNTRLYVPFNEGVGDLAKDYSQYCNHAQLTDVEWSPDGFNGAGKFNGSSSFGNCGNDASLNISEGMIEAWVKYSANPTSFSGHIIHKGDNRLMLYSRAASDAVLFVIGNTSSHTSPEIPFSDIAWSEWSYFVCTYDMVDTKAYLDANLKDTHTDFTEDIETTGDLLIGGYAYFNGVIDKVIISSIVKNTAQIAADCYEVVCS